MSEPHDTQPGARTGTRPGTTAGAATDAQGSAAGLVTAPNLREPGKSYLWPYGPGDDFYEALIDAHRDLDDERSRMLNCRLILLLANHIGDIGVLREALAAAREGIEPDPAA